MPSRNAQVPRLPEASTVTPKTIIAVGAVLPALAAIAVGLRFYVRIAKTKSVGVDDFLILLALTLIIALGIMIIIGSAVHALAQPTPLGDGPEGFLVVLNDAIAITEKPSLEISSLAGEDISGEDLDITEEVAIDEDYGEECAIITPKG